MIYDNAGANTSSLFLSDHEVDSDVGTQWMCGRMHDCDTTQLSQEDSSNWILGRTGMFVTSRGMRLGVLITR